ncbi:MAG: cytochrome c3 family protein [Desulfobacterales bacterium]|nr:MAG: cytochrome c3 family protein [Desulfobacterales bacterium]
MKRKLLKISVISGIALLFVVAGIYAKTVPEVIELNDPAYEEHKKGVVHFEHKKHQNEYAKQYPEFYKNGCGECHHDKDNKPLTELKEGDDVQKCIECHKIAAEAPKGKKAPKKLSKKEKIKEYHAEALHENCKGCHKKFNKKYKPKKAPTTCTTCHPKKAGEKDEDEEEDEEKEDKG